jgi:hypothetical protein
MKSNPDNELGNAIRMAFKKSGLSVRQLARQGNTPYSSTHGFVSGECDVALGTASRYCRVLGLRLTASKKSKRK